jgi:DNA-binding HxlR family transcriptional regulator
MKASSNDRSKLTNIPECPIVDAIKNIGGEWNFIIIRYLNEKPMGFNEILKSVEGLNSKTLSRVLKNLQYAEIVERTIISTQPFLVRYSLTEKGRSLDPVFEALREWGARWAASDIQVSGAK